MSHKRAAETQLTRDNDGEDRAEEEFVTTPQIADESEMATRRVVKVRRPEASSAKPTSGSTSGFFKDAATAASSAAPAKPTFGFKFDSSSNGGGNSSTGTATAFSFGPTPATAAATKPTFGFPASSATAGASSGFSFGNKAAPTATTSTSSFTAATTATSGGGSSSSANPIAFSFGAAPPASGDAAKKPATGFNFGLPATAATTATTASAPGTGSATKEDEKPVFGAGSFNFGSAVNTFVAARNKMQEEAKEAKPGSSEGKTEKNGADGEEDEDEDKPDPAGFGSEIVEQTARDVLVTAPSKLYLFEKGEDGTAGRWTERGTGDAKLISQPNAADADEHIYRLLVRGGYSLNATIKKNTFTLSKTEAKHLILLVATAEGPHTYLLKFTGPSAEANTTKFSEELKKVVAEVSKAE
ncbi:hypothetical protein ABB37_04058 [Leptomonas pyrrhocoris]|uniref:Nuclear pore complex NUP2/50/61 domain-containing protein n=1 Tax=Leptomonas pyrrhocoris TaxID=157538 RepID=A0A0N0VFQ4_LEPPY|nr:hypothetical protein ABB37_04058 [Leptomonas pyrrhocoris]KPA81778.1 hypothetical protein ABB37_04058 [Leptomonas pyrrhocoris]|eukprot:XP_015660217.1 hypothetical protein ABB37_04058 [Leptomonas pyrrhocoris]